MAELEMREWPGPHAFERYRERFRGVYDAVSRLHSESKKEHHGHGLDHDITVATHVLMIAPNQRTAEKAYVAALLHSIDHLLDRSVVGGEYLGKAVGEKVRDCLNALRPNYFSPEEIEEIYDAVMRHEAKDPSSPSETLQILREADMLTNLMPSLVIRAGQFQPNIPGIEFKFLAGNTNPASTYSRPRSVLDDLRNVIREYPPRFKTPKAQELARRYVDMLQRYVVSVEDTYDALGLKNVDL